MRPLSEEAVIDTVRPSVDAWLEEIKQGPGAERVGMYLIHNGVVRATSRDGSPVGSMELTYDRARLEAVLEQIRALPGIVAVKVWIDEGHLEVGDDIMLALVAGDIRPNVLPALEEMVRLIKTEVVAEKECR
jgi:molybdopterin synthase catalytic subunit